MKIFKRALILFFCLAASLYAADWAGSASVPKSTKKIDGKIFYVITSAEELAWFAIKVNIGGETDINAQLANDIKFMDDTSLTSSVGWTPIGRDSTVMFNGIFDGVGHTIYGLNCIQDKFGGMFGVTNKDAVIKNVKLTRLSITGSSGGTDPCVIGGIVGFNNGVVSDCISDALIRDVSDIAGTYFGGIAGVNEGTIRNCTNSGSVSGHFLIGGIAGWNKGEIRGCINSASISSTSSGYGVGGIAGMNEGTIRGCTNDGFVSNGSNIGGIAGVNENGTINGCTNSGSVPLGGGIAGLNRNGTISVCTNNTFFIRKDKYDVASMDGIVVFNEGIVRDCRSFSFRDYGTGLVGNNKLWVLTSFCVTDSARYGTIRSNSNSFISSVYYDSDVNVFGNAEDNSALTTVEMQRDWFAWVLNTANDTQRHSGVWSRDRVGYPIFADSLHLPIYRVIFNNNGSASNRFTNYKGLISLPKDPEPPEGKKFFGWYTDDGIKVEATTVFSKDEIVTAIYDSTQIPHGSSSSEPSDALVANLPSPTWSVTASGRNFQVHAAPVGKPYALFDLQGKVLAKGRIETPEMTLSTPRAGSYIVRIGNHSVRMNAK